jgi:hypothetical protein
MWFYRYCPSDNYVVSIRISAHHRIGSAMLSFIVTYSASKNDSLKLWFLSIDDKICCKEISRFLLHGMYNAIHIVHLELSIVNPTSESEFATWSKLSTASRNKLFTYSSGF